VPVVAVETEGMVLTRVDDDEGGLTMSLLDWMLAGFVWTKWSIIGCNTVSRGFVWVPRLTVVSA
jgi:hypothetical protein